MRYLNAYFQSCTTIRQHLAEMFLQAVIRSCLDCDPDALGAAFLRIPLEEKKPFYEGILKGLGTHDVLDSFLHVVGGVPGQGVVQVPNEVVLVFF